MSNEIVYVCNSCCATFTESEAAHSVATGLPICPRCLSWGIEEGRRCKVCREIVYQHKLRSGVCPACFNDAVSAYKALLSSMTPWAREVLNDEYGNIDITERD